MGGEQPGNRNRANWAKASLIWVAIGIVLYILIFVIIFATASSMPDLSDW